MRFALAGLAAASLLLTAPMAWSAPAASAAAATAAAVAQTEKPAGPSALDPILRQLVIGNPLPMLPDCADKRTPDGRDVTALCVELRGDGLMRQVGVPRDQRPAFMDGPHLVAFVDRNALVGLIVPTDGVRSQQAALDSLTARYGKPFRQEQEAMRDKADKTVQGIHAAWMRRPLTVELYVIPDDPNTGTIELLLPQARALMAEKDAEMSKQLNPAPASAPKAAASKPAAKPSKPGNW